MLAKKGGGGIIAIRYQCHHDKTISEYSSLGIYDTIFNMGIPALSRVYTAKSDRAYAEVTMRFYFSHMV